MPNKMAGYVIFLIRVFRKTCRVSRYAILCVRNDLKFTMVWIFRVLKGLFGGAK